MAEGGVLFDDSVVVGVVFAERQILLVDLIEELPVDGVKTTLVVTEAWRKSERDHEEADQKEKNERRSTKREVQNDR